MLAAYGERYGLDRKTALKVAGAFGGGMARTGSTCGAVTGALMVIGLKHGKTAADDDNARELTYRLSQELAARFRQKHHSLLCTDLLGCDLGTEEGRETAAEQGLFATRCTGFVLDAAELLDLLLGGSGSLRTSQNEEGGGEQQ